MRSITLLSKLAVSVALIAWILSGISMSEILAVLERAHLDVLGIAFSLHGVGLLLSAKRWEMLLGIEKIKLSFKATILAYWIGSFFNAFLPTSVGGDIVRGYLVFKENGKGLETAITVVFERIAGVVGLIIIFGIGTVWLYVSQRELPLWNIVPASAFYLGGSILAGTFSSPAALKIPHAEWRAGARRLCQLVLKYRDHKPELCWIFALSLLLQINVIAYYYLIADALNLDLPLVYFCLYIPPILILTMLPLSLGGLGVRETAFLFFFVPLGNASAAEVLSLSMSSYLLALLAGLLGGLIYCFYQPSYR